MMTNKNLAIVGMFLFSLCIVSAFGVSTPYWNDNPLRLAPGEHTVVEMVLQNMAGNAGDATFNAKIVDDGYGVASLVDEDLDYFVPFGSNDVVVNILVNVSEGVARGGIRDIVVSFSQVGVEEGGMVTVSGGFTAKFPVFVVAPEESALFVPKEETPLMTYVWIGAAVVVAILIVVILWLALRKKKGSKKSKKKK